MNEAVQERSFLSILLHHKTSGAREGNLLFGARATLGGMSLVTKLFHERVPIQNMTVQIVHRKFQLLNKQ